MKSLLAVLCLYLWTSHSASAETDGQWYVVMQGESRIGTMHTTTAEADGRITTTQDVTLAMGRAGAALKIEVSTRFVETVEGKPIEASSSLNLGGRPLETNAVFLDAGIEVTAGQGGERTTTMMPPLAGDWLPPAAAGRRVAERLEAGDQTITVSSVDLSMGLKVVEMTMHVVGHEDIEAYGKTVPAIVWDVTSSATPGITVREYVDAQGETIRSTVDLMPGMTLTIVAAERALAESELSPVEMIDATLITPSRPIERPRELKRGVYRLTTRNGQPMPELPSVGVQRVERDGDASVVTLSMGEPVDEAEVPGEEYLRASPVLNYRDPALLPAHGIYTGPTSKHGGPFSLAHLLRGQVHVWINAKDLSVGFATASDVARTKQGDCTEHAVLLAALLRGAGIPSRCVSGLVYADGFVGRKGIFGFHMWTQAWVKGQWVDFDATLPGGVRFDATHIALSVSDMNDGVAGNDMAALVPLLGNLRIEVVETGYDDKE